MQTASPIRRESHGNSVATAIAGAREICHRAIRAIRSDKWSRRLLGAAVAVGIPSFIFLNVAGIFAAIILLGLSDATPDTDMPKGGEL